MRRVPSILGCIVGVAVACAQEDMIGPHGTCREYCTLVIACVGTLAGSIDVCTEECTSLATACVTREIDEIEDDLEDCSDAGCTAIQSCGADVLGGC